MYPKGWLNQLGIMFHEVDVVCKLSYLKEKVIVA